MSLGPLSGHMAQHIVLMNLVAPLLVLSFARFLPVAGPRFLLPATLIQLGFIWTWHAPFLLPLAGHEPPLHLAMQASLFLAALWFWTAVFSIGGSARWKAILALLVTSKLFCLLGVLLAFSPRVLYGADMCGPAEHCSPAGLLADQQLAGLLMLVACPATYLLAGVVIAARWLRALDEAEAPARGVTHA